MTTQKEVILGVIAVAGLAGLLWFGANQADAPETQGVDSEAAVAYFTETARAKVVAEIGQPIEGFTPSMFMQAYPGLVAQDFEGVEAINGTYTVENGIPVFKLQVAEGDPITSADGAITNEGMKTLLENIADRLDKEVSTAADVQVVLGLISQTDMPDGGDNGGGGDGDGLIFCTMDAKMCPDGSGVGRSGPRCEFAKCPGEVPAGYRTCPDEWIENRMPGPVGDNTPKEYFIIDGKRWEIDQFDRSWVENNCNLEPQYVY